MAAQPVRELISSCSRRFVPELVVAPLPGWVSRMAGRCTFCKQLAESGDGKWWHIRQPGSGRCFSEGEFETDDSVRETILAQVQGNLKIQTSGQPHGSSCDCVGCQVVRDPSRRTGTLGEYFVTHEEYQRLRDDELQKMRMTHPSGCDCKQCDRGY